VASYIISALYFYISPPSGIPLLNTFKLGAMGVREIKETPILCTTIYILLFMDGAFMGMC
jgi:hypothetical protein